MQHKANFLTQTILLYCKNKLNCNRYFLLYNFLLKFKIYEKINLYFYFYVYDC